MNDNSKFRSVFLFKDYFRKFYYEQEEKVKQKILWTIRLVESVDKIPITYLKHIENTDGLFEMRVQVGSDIFRIFCFFDKGKLVVLINGFQKKSQKTPKKEIEKSIKN